MKPFALLALAALCLLLIGCTRFTFERAPDGTVKGGYGYFLQRKNLAIVYKPDGSFEVKFLSDSQNAVEMMQLQLQIIKELEGIAAKGAVLK